MASKTSKSVRFDVKKRLKSEADNGDSSDGEARVSKKARRSKSNDRPTNLDELDDVDDWHASDDNNEDIDDNLPSEKQLLEAKRKRQRLRHQPLSSDDDEDETAVDAATSLASEGIPIEPFNMDQEQTDGTGYFDGDTYVFRRRDEDDEEDAWLEALDNSGKASSIFKSARKTSSDDATKNNNMDAWSRPQLYAAIVPLVSDTETVSQAIVRYGKLISPSTSSARKKTENSKNTAATTDKTNMVQTAMNDLTQAANALLLKGDVDIYQKTRNDLIPLLKDPPSSAATETNTPTNGQAAKSSVQWEYRGNQDGNVHGPYSTAEMLAWTQAGYFKGDQAVQIRIVPDSSTNELLSDLMDDQDDDAKEAKDCDETAGWMSSNDVDFSTYQD